MRSRGDLHVSSPVMLEQDARDYDPEVGRWTSKDPTKLKGGQTNLYAYVHDEPVDAADPRGTGPLDDLLCALFGICSSGPQPGEKNACDAGGGGGGPPPPPEPEPEGPGCSWPCAPGDPDMTCEACCDFYGDEAKNCKSACCSPFR